jgi:hypothetical protein
MIQEIAKIYGEYFITCIRITHTKWESPHRDNSRGYIWISSRERSDLMEHYGFKDIDIGSLFPGIGRKT